MDEKKQSESEIVGILGVGLDNTDELKRITRNEDILLVGGSEETHERMQEISIKFNESLREKGKRLQDAEVKEVIELWYEASEE